jgi:hypothetical protein
MELPIAQPLAHLVLNQGVTAEDLPSVWDQPGAPSFLCCSRSAAIL